ncbi:MAG: ribosomal protein L11 methyltransferase [Cryomorphaceae bacterium]|jgi:ribosomal protein L11 methyltransferase
MSWVQATFVVDAIHVDTLSNMLEGFFAQAITTENAGDEEFYEVAFPGTPDWQKVQVTALFDDAVDLAPIIDFIHAHLSSPHGSEIPVVVDKLIDQDWERVWLDSFRPIEVGRQLWVCPSWCEPTDPNARNITLDPGLAFGTGTHATTHMCLEWIAEQKLSGQRVLDYGSGSGILAIAALFSDAQRADAVDIDPMAVQACGENACRNNVEHKMHSWLPEDLDSDAKHTYDLVIANILADVIIELRDTLLLHLRPEGTLLLTGILASQADRVINAFGESFDFSQTNSKHQDKGHWALLTGTRKLN